MTFLSQCARVRGRERESRARGIVAAVIVAGAASLPSTTSIEPMAANGGLASSVVEARENKQRGFLYGSARRD